MFNRSPGPETKSPDLPKPLTMPGNQSHAMGGGSPSGSPFAPSSTMGSSVIGTDLAIIGEKITIISQNRLQIDGDIRGDVNGKQIIIGEDGSVVGTVSAETIDVRGGVRGAIRAQTVTLHPTAQVDGDIVHQKLSISEGAQFDGRVRRAKTDSEWQPNLDPNSVAAATGASVAVSG